MRRPGIALLLILLPFCAPAQEAPPAAPVLRQEIDADTVVPGQALVLRLTVLVPSYLPQPPGWPAFNAPDLMVRLPERSTGPVSAQVGGESWSGVSRRYSIVPLKPGDFVLPAADLTVTWADPETNAPRRATLRTQDIRITARVPEAAAGLDPFVAATGLTLSREVEGDPAAMAQGDAVAVTVTAEIAGAPAMTIPPLIALPAIDGIAAYPDAPQFADTADGGTRRERVALVAEGHAAGTLPGLSIGWYDLESGRVDTAALEPLAIAATAPGRARAGPEMRRRTALTFALLAISFGAGVWLRRRLAPWRARAEARRLASEPWAWRQLQEALGRRDFPGLQPALDLWAERRGGGDARGDPSVAAALAALGAARYAGRGDADAAWQALARALTALRHRDGEEARPAALPPLNPTF
ncbi:BatD family protein [Poseidonocella sp. HB161398]|uniref:BatD family protein n=1 Tax=Poseidonocella sp. HB161398 TaxID=2320855 RepID=UPI0011094767|nr:BatD family protein [Poseidonocella sp. HB161398]